MNPTRPRAARCVALKNKLVKIAVFLDPASKIVIADCWAFDVRSLSSAMLAAIRSAYDIVERLRAKPRIDNDRPEVIAYWLKDMLAQVSQMKYGIGIGHVVDALSNGCL